MKWYEFIILFLLIGLIILPFILSRVKKNKKEEDCPKDCSCCDRGCPIKKYLKK